MKLYPAIDSETGRILGELENAKRRYQSHDFLDGFPLATTKWYRADVEYSELEELFLFWDGSAWGESPHKLPVRLKDGVAAFERIDNGPGQSNNVHLNQIKQWLKKYEAGEVQNSEPFLILGGLGQSSRLIILDGNHRAAAALWWAMRTGDHSQLPLNAWIGLSPDMVTYRYYRRILCAR